jgi:hypothetical protein
MFRIGHVHGSVLTRYVAVITSNDVDMIGSEAFRSQQRHHSYRVGLYRLLFAKVLAKRKGQADRVIEFIDPKSDLAKSIAKEYWVKEETEKPKLSATQVIQKVREAGFKTFGMYQHTQFWKEHDGKNPSKGFGTTVVNTWYWYQNWVTYVITELGKTAVVS